MEQEDTLLLLVPFVERVSFFWSWYFSHEQDKLNEDLELVNSGIFVEINVIRLANYFK